MQSIVLTGPPCVFFKLNVSNSFTQATNSLRFINTLHQKIDQKLHNKVANSILEL